MSGIGGFISYLTVSGPGLANQDGKQGICDSGRGGSLYHVAYRTYGVTFRSNIARSRGVSEGLCFL